MKQQRYIIGIGAQKSGTTWLANYLSGHPEVLVSPLKELHFFDSLYAPELCPGFEKKKLEAFIELAHKLRPVDVLKGTKRFNRFNRLYERVKINGDIQHYREYFAHYANNESVFCEITPSYALIDDKGFAAIKSLADDVRLIFLLRNPIDRIWSALRMSSKKTPEVDILLNFENFLDQAQISLRTEYSQTLSTVYSVFPQDRVFVQFYERLFDPDAIAQLCDFCGVGYVAPDIEKRLLEGIPAPLTASMRESIYNKFRHIYDWAEAKFGAELPESWQADIAAFR